MALAARRALAAATADVCASAPSMSAARACAPAAASPAGAGLRRSFSLTVAAPAAAAPAAAVPERLAKYLPLSKWDLPADLRPTRVAATGAVHNPRLSGLGRAKVRKAALLAMAAGDTANVWDGASWDRPLAPKVLRQPKSSIGKDAKMWER
jgi:hypothetical protein